jgi:hypothetical protein
VSIPADLFTALRALAGDRVYPDTFPQDVAWPAIRVTFIGAVPDATICGNGGDSETDFTVQIDGIARKGVDRDSLRASIAAAMATFSPPAILESWSNSYDEETKSYRVLMQYFLHPSST